MLSSKILIAAVIVTFAMGVTARADHYARSCGVRYVSYAPAYYRPVYAPTPVVYTTPVCYAPYRPVMYVEQPVYYPRYYAPAPVYRTYYAPSSFSFGFGFGHAHGGHYNRR